MVVFYADETPGTHHLPFIYAHGIAADTLGGDLVNIKQRKHKFITGVYHCNIKLPPKALDHHPTWPNHLACLFFFWRADIGSDCAGKRNWIDRGLIVCINDLESMHYAISHFHAKSASL